MSVEKTPYSKTNVHYRLNEKNEIVYESKEYLPLPDMNEMSDYISKYHEIQQFFQLPTSSDIPHSSSSSTNYV
jgi:hypothetical protein